jgi:uncharacterized protein (DUF2062 family)
MPSSGSTAPSTTPAFSFKGLSKPVIIGLIIGAVLLLLLIIVIAVVAARKKRSVAQITRQYGGSIFKNLEKALKNL